MDRLLSNVELLLPHMPASDIVRTALTCRRAADGVSGWFHMQYGWSTANVSTVDKLLRVLRGAFCKYCPCEPDLAVHCSDHWCKSCGAYRPVYNYKRPKYPYVCQKCTLCESCSGGTPAIRYVYSREHDRHALMFAMAICDRCVRECGKCGNPDRYLCIDEESGLRKSRCRHCKPQVAGMVMVSKFSVD